MVKIDKATTTAIPIMALVEDNSEDLKLDHTTKTGKKAQELARFISKKAHSYGDLNFAIKKRHTWSPLRLFSSFYATRSVSKKTVKDYYNTSIGASSDEDSEENIYYHKDLAPLVKYAISHSLPSPEQGFQYTASSNVTTITNSEGLFKSAVKTFEESSTKFKKKQFGLVRRAHDVEIKTRKTIKLKSAFKRNKVFWKEFENWCVKKKKDSNDVESLYQFSKDKKDASLDPDQSDYAFQSKLKDACQSLYTNLDDLKALTLISVTELRFFEKIPDSPVTAQLNANKSIEQVEQVARRVFSLKYNETKVSTFAREHFS